MNNQKQNQSLNPYISIQQTDATIMRYITQVIKPMVQDQSGNIVPVPVVYNGAERWVQARKRKFLVNQDGNPRYPVISFSRTSISYRDPKYINRIWLSGYRNYITIQNEYSKQRPYSTMDKQYGSMADKRNTVNIMIPLDIVCNYEFQIYTDNWQDMNDLVQSFMLYTNRWWIIDNAQVKVKVTQYMNSIQMQQSQQRLIKTNFTMDTVSTLLPKSYQPMPVIDLATTRKVKVTEIPE